MTASWLGGQRQPDFSRQPSTTSPTRYRVRHCTCSRKSSSSSAWQPRAPRCRSLMKTGAVDLPVGGGVHGREAPAEALTRVRAASR